MGPLRFQDISTKIRTITILEINGLLRHSKIIKKVEPFLIKEMSLAYAICLSWCMCGLTSIEKTFIEVHLIKFIELKRNFHFRQPSFIT